MVGRFRSEDITKIFQVTSKTEMLVQHEWETLYTSTRSIGGSYERGSTHSVTKSNRHDELIKIKGLSTKGLANNTFQKFKHVFTVTGSNTYNTSHGSNTVLVLEPVNINPYLR